jgi:hypothetical protein
MEVPPRFLKARLHPEVSYPVKRIQPEESVMSEKGAPSRRLGNAWQAASSILAGIRQSLPSSVSEG